MGDYFVDHFAGTREHELEVFRRAVTDWEGGSFFFLFLPLFPLLPALHLSYTGLFTSRTSSSTSSPRQSLAATCPVDNANMGNELTISPTIHRIDLGNASCMPIVQNHEVRREGEKEYGGVLEIPVLVLGYLKVVESGS